jgi:hypothetical protein
VRPPAPVADASNPPTISGTPQPGDTLSVTNNGTWANDPTGFSYVWEDCDSTETVCSAISAPDSSSYTLQPTDLGSTIVALVTASNAGGGSTAASNGLGPVVPPAPVVDSSNPPTISGTAELGDTLTVTSNGTWENDPAFTYAWEDCNGSSCATITGAASSSYTLQSTDVGDTVVAVVTGTNSGGHSSATSNSLGPVVLPPPQDTIAPGITGTAQQGDTLTATPGIWNNSPNYGYAWQDCDTSGNNCSAISGATSSTYKLAAADVGKLVSVTVTASNSGGQSAITSQSVGPVVPPTPVNTTAPQVAGNNVTAAPVSTGVQGTITSTMQWAFYYTPSYTQVRALVVNGALPGATVLVKCHGTGCPFASHSTLLGKRARCGKKTKAMCSAYGSFLVTPGFASRHLGVGARITIEIIRPSWVGKFYSFTVRSRQGPRIHIGCLAPGAGVPGQGC